MSSVLISGFLIGLAGAGHCLGMCGGLASLLSLNGQPSKLRIIFYNLGRALSYLLFTLLLASVVHAGATQFYSDLMIPLRTLAGILLIFMGLYICGASKLILKIEAIGKLGWNVIAPVAKKMLPITSAKQAFIAGCVWGWLPCGLVYSTVLWAASLGSISLSVIAIIGFALGTLPAMLLAGFFSQQLKQIWTHYKLHWLFGTLLVIYGCLSIPMLDNLFSQWV